MTNYYKCTPRAEHEKPTIRRKQLISRFRQSSYKYSRLLRQDLHRRLGKIRYQWLSRLRHHKWPRTRHFVKYDPKILSLPFWQQVKIVKRPFFKIKDKKKDMFYESIPGSVGKSLTSNPLEITERPFSVYSIWSKNALVHVAQHMGFFYKNSVPFFIKKNKRKVRHSSYRFFSNFTNYKPILSMRSTSAIMSFMKAEYTGRDFNILSNQTMFWKLGMFRTYGTPRNREMHWLPPTLSRSLLFPQSFLTLQHTDNKRLSSIKNKSIILKNNRKYYRRLLIKSYSKHLIKRISFIKKSFTNVSKFYKKFEKLKKKISSKIEQINKVFNWTPPKRSYKSTLILPNVQALREFYKSDRERHLRRLSRWYKTARNYPQYRQDLVPPKYRHDKGPHQADKSKFSKDFRPYEPKGPYKLWSEKPSGQQKPWKKKRFWSKTSEPKDPWEKWGKEDLRFPKNPFQRPLRSGGRPGLWLDEEKRQNRKSYMESSPKKNPHRVTSERKVK